jgi:hypothetical protein
MALFVLFFLACSAMSSEVSIEDKCKTCVQDGNQVYYRVMFSPYVQSDFICRPSSALVSKFGYVVDSACDDIACKNISYRPLLRNSYRQGYFDCRLNSEVPAKEHSPIVQLVRDYLELLLLGIMCTLLVLKKKLLTECVNRLKPLDQQEEETVPNNEFHLPLTRMKRMKLAEDEGEDVVEGRPPFNIYMDTTVRE